LTVALDAKEAFDFLGLPEGSLALVEAAVYCAMAPRSTPYGRERPDRRGRKTCRAGSAGDPHARRGS
jgi:putative ATPase